MSSIATLASVQRQRMLLACAKDGMKAEEIAVATGLSRATIYREIKKIEQLKAAARERRAS